jgi:hypothetical protein
MSRAGRTLLWLGMAAVLAAGQPKMASAKPAPRTAEPIRQVALSEEKITQFLAARPALDAVLAKAPASAAAPDPRLLKALNDAARKDGFADYADYETVAINIVWILTGIDPLNKKYVGVPALTKLEVINLLSDKSLSPKQHKLLLEALHMQMLSAAPVKYAANVPLVVKFYDKLLAADAKN